MLDELVKIALIGTARGGGAALPSPPAGALGDALASLPAATGPEAALLRAAALGSAYEACGRVPVEAPPLPEPARPDARPACPPRAADLLGRLLAMTNTPTKAQLLDEWLEYADRAGRRAPHGALPALLDYGAGRRASRERIAAVADARGRWLMAKNPQWRFDVDAEQDVRAAWSTGTPPQRLAALRRARRDDPAAARALVQSTWKEDGADERAAFVAAFADGLSSEDEPFLESSLDDRSKQVRAAAVELLVRVPTSALVARMTVRADAMLSLKGKTIDVALPTKFDPDWARDGVGEKPSERIGQKQFWLRQIVAAVPPSHWSNAWRLDPAACLRAAAGDFEAVLIDAWAEAAARAGDVAWAAALLRASFGANLGRVRTGLFNVIPAGERPALFAEALAAADVALPNMPQAPTDLALPAVAHFLSSANIALDRTAAAALLAWFERHVTSSKPAYQYALPPLLTEVALRVPPAMFDEFAARWAGPFWDANAKALEQFLQTLQLRRDVQREFAT